MRALNCEQLSPEVFDKNIAELLSEPIYAPSKNEPTAPVTFRFNLPAALLSDTIFIIESNKADCIIYRDTYQDKFTIQADKNLLNDGGGDSFQFSLWNKKTYEVCSAGHESEPFWQANKTVHVEFLPFRELNEIGLPVVWKVRIE